jgi:hypothetical protein
MSATSSLGLGNRPHVSAAQALIPAGVKADSLKGFQAGKHLTMSIGVRDWVNA